MQRLLINKEGYDELTKEFKDLSYYGELIYPDKNEYLDYLSLGKNIFVLLGVSGAGKTTMANRLVEEDGFIYLPRITSRARRLDESDGEYIFKDEVEFDENDFFTLKKYAGNYYAIDKDILISSRKNPDTRIMIAGTYEGFALKDTLPRVSLIYLEPEKNLADLAVKNRNDLSQYNMRTSLQRLDELSRCFSDHVIYNEMCGLDKPVREIEHIIQTRIRYRSTI